MLVTTLIENTSRDESLKCEFGLSFYLETTRHRILFDTGATGAIVENAAVLGIDLSQVDTVVISHGHYDHGGGLGAFLKLNENAAVYIQKQAFGDYFSHRESGVAYIGLDKTLAGHPQIVSVAGNLSIDDELFLFSGVKGKELIPATNGNLLHAMHGIYGADTFAHEQNLLVRENGKHILFAGCAHCGIVNILARCKELTGAEPDRVFGGFHLASPGAGIQADNALLETLARRLLHTKASYYTCHCTGQASFDILHSLMGSRIRYIATGDRI